MASRKNDFRPEDAVKALLWCRRVCCLCGKKCGVGIELAHIDRNGPKSLDNAIPVCFDCHCAIGHYVDDHPKGKKYGITELKKRRNQVYGEQTSALVPIINYRLTQSDPTRKLPAVGFQISHVGGVHPAKAYVTITGAKGSHPPTVGHYNGRYAWNLNPGHFVRGWFKIRKGWQPLKGEPLRVRVEVSIRDIYGYLHDLLPVGYVLDFGAGEWYAEPCEELMQATPEL